MQQNPAKRKPRLIDRWRAMPVPRRIAILVLSSFAFLYIFGRYYTNISESIQRNRDPYYRDAEEFLSLFNEQIAHADMALVYDKNDMAWKQAGDFYYSVTLPVGGASVPTVCVLTADRYTMDIDSVAFIQTLPAGTSAGNELYMFSQVVSHIYFEDSLEWAIRQETEHDPRDIHDYQVYEKLRNCLLLETQPGETVEFQGHVSNYFEGIYHGTTIDYSRLPSQKENEVLHKLLFCSV